MSDEVVENDTVTADERRHGGRGRTIRRRARARRVPRRAPASAGRLRELPKARGAFIDGRRRPRGRRSRGEDAARPRRLRPRRRALFERTLRRGRGVGSGPGALARRPVAKRDWNASTPSASSSIPRCTTRSRTSRARTVPWSTRCCAPGTGGRVRYCVQRW